MDWIMRPQPLYNTKTTRDPLGQIKSKFWIASK